MHSLFHPRFLSDYRNKCEGQNIYTRPQRGMRMQMVSCCLGLPFWLRTEKVSYKRSGHVRCMQIKPLVVSPTAYPGGEDTPHPDLQNHPCTHSRTQFSSIFVMSWLTRQNRMSYLKARDLHLFSLRRINNQLDISRCSNPMA